MFESVLALAVVPEVKALMKWSYVWTMPLHRFLFDLHHPTMISTFTIRSGSTTDNTRKKD